MLSGLTKYVHGSSFGEPLGERISHLGRQAVQQLVRHPLLLHVAQERARAHPVVQRAVRVLAHQVHRAVRLELALERPRVQMRGRGGTQRVPQSPQSPLVLLDQRGVQAAAGARRAALQVHLHHHQPLHHHHLQSSNSLLILFDL